MSLTQKQERFAHEYVVDHNAAAAARRAGYSPHTARQIGSRNLQHPGVQQLIAKLTASKFAELGLRRASRCCGRSSCGRCRRWCNRGCGRGSR